MPLTAVCSADSSHEINQKWIRWISGKPYIAILTGCADKDYEITHCPKCGAAIKVIDKCPRNKQCWGSSSPQCEGEYEDCPVYKKGKDCIAPRDYGKLPRCATCKDKLRCSADAHGELDFLQPKDE